MLMEATCVIPPFHHWENRALYSLGNYGTGTVSFFSVNFFTCLSCLDGLWRKELNSSVQKGELPKYLRGETNVTRSTCLREKGKKTLGQEAGGRAPANFQIPGSMSWFGFSNNARLFSGSPFPQVFEVRGKEVPQHLDWINFSFQ